MVYSLDNRQPQPRSRWSEQEVQKLALIYEQEILKGKKQLWKRISLRVNASIRKTKRQAIEYKWKNYCSHTFKEKNRITKNQKLIQELLKEIPYKGYAELAKNQPFTDITQSNIKNIFYSTIRSLTKFMSKHVDQGMDPREITNILTNRDFLRFMAEAGMKLNTIRQSSIKMKEQLKRSRKSNGKEYLSETMVRQRDIILSDLDKIKSFYYESYIKGIRTSQARNVDIGPSIKKQEKLKLVSLQMIYESKSTHVVGESIAENNMLDEQINLSLSTNLSKLFKIQSFPSIVSLFNDF